MNRGRRLLLIAGLITVVFIALAVWQRDLIRSWFLAPTDSSLTPGVSRDQLEHQPQIVAKDLQTPWDIAVLPSDELLVTERSGVLKRIGQEGRSYPIDNVRSSGESGLMGLALHPDFETNQQIYLCYTTERDGHPVNLVVRYRLKDDQLSDRMIILDSIPAAEVHDGGQLAFGPDDKLYITTGDAGKERLAQNKDSLAGKILRLNPDGTVPADNPFDNAVWSYGHRNPQGLAWDVQGRLWATEHGPSGADSGNDELNLIKKGLNYGWPQIIGNESKAGMVTPVATSGDDETWAPAGLAYVGGSLYFTGLRGQTLYEAEIVGDNVELSTHFAQDFGRLRAITAASGELYISTSNTDGRGLPRPGDDRIIKFNAAVLNQ